MKKKLKKRIIGLLKKKEDSDNVFIEEVRDNLSDFKSLLSEIKITPVEKKQNTAFKSVDILKQHLIDRYRKIGDEKAILTKGRSYSGNQMADEIENETEFGIQSIKSLISLTIELLSRDKLKINEDE